MDGLNDTLAEAEGEGDSMGDKGIERDTVVEGLTEVEGDPE